MSDVLQKAADALNEKLGGEAFDGSLKIAINDVGSIMLDSDGARVADEDAECTMTADQDTFEGMLTGDVNPTMAFMGGQLSVDGDMSQAMKLGAMIG